MIDVLLPSRGRSELLRRSVQSLRDTASDPAGVAVHVAADMDDPGTVATAVQLDVTSVLIMHRKGYAGLHHYFNALAGASSGSWLLLWNDDSIMTTPGWDRVILDLPGDVLIADLWSAHSPGLVTFPAVRRTAVVAVGGFCLGNCHCDTFWQDIGRETGTIRQVPIQVHHDRFDLTGHNDDQTWRDAQDGGQHSRDYSSPENQAIRAECVRKIKEMAS